MVTIIGRGNVASHLYQALKDKTEVTVVNPRTLEELPAESDFIIISVSDNAIREIVEKLPPTDAIVAHTAGSVPMECLKGASDNFGVFYPLQTFTKGITLDYSKIPVFIEGSSPEVVSSLKRLAVLFSENVREADSEKRKNLHLASVFACNFTNAMASISRSLLEDAGVDFSALVPLMQQTVNKLQDVSPEKAQTGPAVRGDTNVMESHLKMLENRRDLQQIYSILSQYISKNIKNES